MFDKKICILTSVHRVFDVRIFHKEAKTLIKAGYDVTLIAQHNRNEIVDGGKIIALSKPKNRFFRIFFLTKKTYKIALKEKADIYHFHDPELLPWMLKLKKKTVAKIIYDVHEDVPKQILSKYWLPAIIRKPISILFNLFEKFISKKFDYIVTATPDIKNNFKNHKVTDVKNYPIITNLWPIKDCMFPKNKNCYNLIYVGGLEKIRGAKEMVQSLKFINPKYNVKLKLLGRFSEENFKGEIKNLKEYKKVEFFGFVSQKRAYRELTETDIGLVCLHPLRRFFTSLPLKIFEYMAAGLPIIASDFSLWKEIIEGNKCGICINPLNPKEIAKAIEYLLEHPGEAKRMGENGRKAVLEKYNWKNESKKLLKIYDKLTEK